MLRKVDVIARFGGDEFVVILVDTDSNTAKNVGQKILERINECAFSNKKYAITPKVSMGIASYPIHASDAADIVKAVDRALGVAKRAGGNKLFSATPLASSEDRASASTGPFRTL
jgi:diguanylate cyclase (GGDEF)-like protein